MSQCPLYFVQLTEISSVDMIPSARKLGEPIRSAIPLHPPYHPSEPRAPCPIGKEYLRSSHCSPTMNSTGEGTAFSTVSGKACFQLDQSLQIYLKVLCQTSSQEYCTNQRALQFLKFTSAYTCIFSAWEDRDRVTVKGKQDEPTLTECSFVLGPVLHTLQILDKLLLRTQL